MASDLSPGAGDVEGKFFRDDRGFPQARFPHPYQVVGWFLQQDVQSSPNTCDEFLSICEDVESGQIDRWEGTGNAHTVEIDKRGVTITNEFTEDRDSCHISMEDFRRAIQLWRNLVTQ